MSWSLGGASAGCVDWGYAPGPSRGSLHGGGLALPYVIRPHVRTCRHPRPHSCMLIGAWGGQRQGSPPHAGQSIRAALPALSRSGGGSSPTNHAGYFAVARRYGGPAVLRDSDVRAPISGARERTLRAGMRCTCKRPTCSLSSAGQVRGTGYKFADRLEEEVGRLCWSLTCALAPAAPLPL